MRNDLRDARVRAGLTQTEMAERIGRDQGSVSRYESGQSAITTDVAPAIARVLDIDVLTVLYGPGFGEPPSEQERAA